ncbi:hypothetical protein [Thermostaphylospora chromogena]|uniref:Uncharacterized protein n=1 Tax=Thermostaphylospora chromogena TaxID=35622 RepID=A0A1H1HUI5_9ACTN|nr:hypothetical protein [Thermostaphylospora chromogena]SDR29122.1 hypothetical protein SAMN04489764_4842 [Thermostaphylospora chromogena]
MPCRVSIPPSRTGRTARTAAVVLLGCLLSSGCSELAEISGAVVSTQACENAVTAVADLTHDLHRLRGKPAETDRALKEAADRLSEAAGYAGDDALRKTLDGLADSYRKLTGGAEIEEKAASITSRYLPMINASCGRR